MLLKPIKSSAFQDTDIVRLDQVSKRYGETVALKDLSLEVRRGEFLTLLGPSGCGKTTTLRLISGFEVPDIGSVIINGRHVNDVPPFRRDVNTVFQNYALFPHLTVFENVAYALRVKRLARAETRAKVSAMLERVGLTAKAARYPRELSGGQMQRVALARALINEPTVLLLDEPLSALDAKLRRAMQLELRRMHAELGLTFVCVTHDQEEALVMSDRIAVLQEGEIAQIGTPPEVFEKPSNRFVADFIGGCNFLPARVDSRGALVLPDGTTSAPGLFGARRPVVLAVRPQKIRIGEVGAGPAVVSTTAQLLDVVYLGTAVRLVLQLEHGPELTAEIDQDGVRGADLATACALRLWVAADDVIIFDDRERPSDVGG